MANHMQRGKMQVMYNFPPGTTFSNPKHNLIEKSGKMYGDQMEIASEVELIQAVHASLDNWDGGVENALPSPTPERWAIIDPASVYSEIFPRVFECMSCGRIHDYSEDNLWKLEQNGDTCQNQGCDGTLTQIHHVGVCPSCSDISSIHVPRCDEHGHQHMKLDDRADRYQNFKWVCDAGNHNNTLVNDDFLTFCDCGQMMEVTVHSSSKATNVHDLTRVDLSGHDIYQSDLRDPDEIDPLVIGAYLDEFDHPETTLKEIVERDEISQIDLDEVDTDDPEVIKTVRQAMGQVGSGDRPDLIRAEVNNQIDDINPSVNLRRYIQLQEIMDQESVRDTASAREIQLMDQMGIADIGVTSEFPLLKAVYGYHRTFENQEDGDPEPAARLFPSVEVEDGDYRRPIYTTRSETEAAIIQLDPRDVGHWLSEAGYSIEDTREMELSDARATLYNAMEPVEPYTTDINGDNGDHDPYNEVTKAVHRLLHTISHLLLQRAAVHSGIEETSFAEYLFTEGLATAIYSNNTQNYTAGGLFTLIDRNLEDWLLSTLRQGERCVYDSTCANIRNGACHACLHISEIGCQHFNKNLSRIAPYGKRIAADAPTGYWSLTGGLGGTSS